MRNQKKKGVGGPSEGPNLWKTGAIAPIYRESVSEHALLRIRGWPASSLLMFLP